MLHRNIGAGPVLIASRRRAFCPSS